MDGVVVNGSGVALAVKTLKSITNAHYDFAPSSSYGASGASGYWAGRSYSRTPNHFFDLNGAYTTSYNVDTAICHRHRPTFTGPAFQDCSLSTYLAPSLRRIQRISYHERTQTGIVMPPFFIKYNEDLVRPYDNDVPNDFYIPRVLLARCRCRFNVSTTSPRLKLKARNRDGLSIPRLSPSRPLALSSKRITVSMEDTLNGVSPTLTLRDSVSSFVLSFITHIKDEDLVHPTPKTFPLSSFHIPHPTSHIRIPYPISAPTPTSAPTHTPTTEPHMVCSTINSSRLFTNANIENKIEEIKTQPIEGLRSPSSHTSQFQSRRSSHIAIPKSSSQTSQFQSRLLKIAISEFQSVGALKRLNLTPLYIPDTQKKPYQRNRKQCLRVVIVND
ncbi:hypothetical protein CPB83DRAFT_899679 [Crepidotus variabilis]|uniref:Uncharacterized protein n=1 Tax=Crepidotus variabilis TaxID=179855 RepID=A0A9P6E4H8_9AGAR|nr:hypothetical protein CPB83DRAFT_899679 [Crepidotus variabilis]